MSFKTLYKEKIRAQLQKELACNIMAVPKLSKITLNIGTGTDKKVLESALHELALIAGQRPVQTLARKSIAGFKIRQGWPIGCKVTLRNDAMYDFFERLVMVAMPRIRDFRGFSANAFDGRGNYTLGLTEQIIFPEIDYDKVDGLRGMDIAITTSATSDKDAHALFRAFGFPFSGDFREKKG